VGSIPTLGSSPILTTPATVSQLRRQRHRRSPIVSAIHHWVEEERAAQSQVFVLSGGRRPDSGAEQRRCPNLAVPGSERRACTRSSTATRMRSIHEHIGGRTGGSANPAMYRSGMKWSGVGTASWKSEWSRRPMIPAGEVVRCSRLRRQSGGPSRIPVRLVPVDAAQIVDDVPASDDEDAALAQWRELGTSSRWYSNGLSALMDSWTTGMSALGKACRSTDHVPWSRPQLSWSSPIQVGLTISATSSARAGSPAAGTPPQRAHREPVEVVDRLGRVMAVTAEKFTYQCAETTRMARGRGLVLPNVRHASV